MKGKDWLILVVVVIIVAVVASLVTVKLTGNVISVAKGTAAKVYTTDEVDAKLADIRSAMCAKYTTLKQEETIKGAISGQAYDVTNSYMSGGEVILAINGVKTPKLMIGQTYKIPSATSSAILSIKDITYRGYNNSSSYVGFVISDC
jgi:hypothetical protein